MLFPKVMSVASDLSAVNNMPSPFMEVGATGLAFRNFCAGIGGDHPDIVNSSRKISASEAVLCDKNGVRFGEIGMEYDAIVFVVHKGFALSGITREEVFKAISAYVFDDNGILVKNPNTTWDQINDLFPKKPIVFYGTMLTSGTYDFLLQKVIAPYCEKAKIDDPTRPYCGMVRTDGRYVPISGGYTLNIQKMSARPDSMAMIPYSFLDGYYGQFDVVALDGVVPDRQNIADYQLSRMLYVYYKKNNIGTVPHLGEFVAALNGVAVRPDLP